MASGNVKSAMFKTHLIIVCFCVVIILISLATIYFVRVKTNEITTEKYPVIAAIENVKKGLQKSNVVIKQWSDTKNKEYLEQNNQIWSEEITPSFEEISAYAKETNDKVIAAGVARLSNDLYDVKEWQGHTNEIIQNKTGKPTLKYATLYLEPRARAIEQITTSFVETENKQQSKPLNNVVYKDIKDLQTSFNKSSVLLNRSIIEGSQELMKQSTNNFNNVSYYFSKLSTNKKALTSEQFKMLGEMGAELRLYRNYRNKLQEFQAQNAQVIASEIYDTEIKPRLVQTFKILDVLAENKNLMRAQNLEFMNTALNIALTILICALIVLIIGSWFVINYNLNSFMRPVNALLKKTKGTSNFNGDKLDELVNTFNTMQQKITSSKSILKSVIETSIDPIVFVSNTGNITLYNSAALALFDYPEEEFTTKNIKELIPDSDQAENDEPSISDVDILEENILEKELNVDILTKSGEHIPVLISRKEVTIDGQVYFVEVIHNLTREQSDKKTIDHINSQIQKEQESKSLIIMINTGLRNAASPSDFASRLLKIFDEHLNISKSVFYKVNSEQNIATMFEQHGFTSSAKIPISFNINDGPIGETLSRKKTQYLSQVAFDYLNETNGSIDVLLQECFLLPLIHNKRILAIVELRSDSKMDNEQQDFIKELSTYVSLRYYNSLTEQELKDSLKSTATYLREDVLLKDMVEQCFSMIMNAKGCSNLKLQHSIKSSLMISTDPIRLNEALINLLFFLVRSENSSGSIEVLYDSETDDNVKFSIEDSAVRISDEQHQAIFRDGEQEDIQGSRCRNNLFIANQMIKKMGGEFSIDNRVDQGSVFWVTLPKGLTL